jgi:hypothetical protein
MTVENKIDLPLQEEDIENKKDIFGFLGNAYEVVHNKYYERYELMNKINKEILSVDLEWLEKEVVKYRDDERLGNSLIELYSCSSVLQDNASFRYLAKHLSGILIKNGIISEGFMEENVDSLRVALSIIEHADLDILRRLDIQRIAWFIFLGTQQEFGLRLDKVLCFYPARAIKKIFSVLGDIKLKNFFTEMIIAEYEREINRIIHSEDETGLAPVFDIIESAVGDVSIGVFDALVRQVFKEFGVDIRDAYESVHKSVEDNKVRISDDYFHFQCALESDIDTMKILKKRKQELFVNIRDKQGIRSFGRYPLDLLLHQETFYKDNYNEAEYQKGIIIYPYSDHNIAFHFSANVLEEIISKKRPNTTVKIYESGSALGVAKIIIKEGSRKKIQFGIIGGHGSKNSIQMKKDNRITVSHLNIKSIGSLSRLFEGDASVLFESCCTGVPKGIAEEASVKLGIQSVGPDDNAAIKEIECGYNAEGKFIFQDISFVSEKGEKVKTMKYYG